MNTLNTNSSDLIEKPANGIFQIKKLTGLLRKLDNNLDKIFIGLLIFTLFPLFFIACHNYPTTDDYAYTNELHTSGFLRMQKDFFLHLNGRYFATLLASLNPLIFHSIIGYKSISILLITFFILAIYWLCRHLFKESKRIPILGFASLLIAAYFVYLPDIEEGVFWMMGSITYYVPSILTVLFIGCILKFLQSKKQLFFAYSILCLCAIIGSDEVAMLFIDIIVSLLVLTYLLRDGKINYYLFVLLGLSILFSIIIFTSPGNNVRSSYFPLRHQLYNSYHNSIITGNLFLHQWRKSFLYIFLLSFAFIYRNLPAINLTKPKLLLNTIIALLLCWIIPFIGVFPGYWSMGTIPPLRTVNVVYFYFMLSSIYFFISLSNYLKQYAILNRIKLLPGIQLVLAFIVLYHVYINPKETNNLKIAYADITSGRITNYTAQLNKRLEIINSCKKDTCVVPIIENIPKTLYFDDNNAIASDWRTQVLSEYFDKKVIISKQ